jgi:hypothetical protein
MLHMVVTHLDLPHPYTQQQQLEEDTTLQALYRVKKQNFLCEGHVCLRPSIGVWTNTSKSWKTFTKTVRQLDFQTLLSTKKKPTSCNVTNELFHVYYRPKKKISSEFEQMRDLCITLLAHFYF